MTQTSFISREIKSWFGNVGGDIWGGLVTTFALLPETIGFMLAVGVPPYLGLYTCICLTIILAFTGGRPGVITAGAGSTAMILVGTVAKFWDTHPEYIFAAVVLAGIIQFILGVCRFGNLVKYLPQCVMNGFVNGLAILIFISQVKLMLRDMTTLPEMLILVILGLAVIVAFPMLSKVLPFTKSIPSSLIAIILITVYVLVFKRPVLLIADLGAIAPSFKLFGSVVANIGNIFTAECIGSIWSVALSIAFIGIIETMLTCRVVTEETSTPEQENLNRECRGQGIGNIVCGLVGAMPGCAMIGQTKVCLGAGGRGRLASFTAGIVLLILLFLANPVLGMIPIAALVAVMLKACYDTFSWESVFKCYKFPLRDTVTMLLTVLVVVRTSNLAYGVGAGILLYAVLYLLKKVRIPVLHMMISAVLVVAAVYVLIIAFFKPGLGLMTAIIGLTGAGIASLSRKEMDSTRSTEIICTVIIVLGVVLAAAGTIVMYIL